MTDNTQTVRIACANENCGTFPIDRQLRNKLQKTGETFTCPAGHEQHFSESPLKKKEEQIKALKSKVEGLESRLEKYKGQAMDRWDETREERKRADHLERMLLSRANGIVEVGKDAFKWSCTCGSHGRDSYETAEEARKRFKEHQRRNDCENGVTDTVIEA